MSNAPTRSKYQKLIADIVAFYGKTKREVALFYWQAGRWIVEIEQDGASRAQYGSGLLQQVSEDLTRLCGPGFSKRNLERMRRLYLTRQKTTAPSQLTWTQQVELLPIRDEKIRARIEKRVLKDGLGSREIRRLVQKETGYEKPAPVLPPLVRPTDLKLGTCRYGEGDGDGTSNVTSPSPSPSVELDLGFFVSYPVTREEAATLTITDAPSYTYAARIIRVVDGDTLYTRIYLGFGVKVTERVRLRGINTPELGTPEGERAKKFVQNLLPVGSLIVLKSHKCTTDPHGRFVEDVFYLGKDSSPNTLRPRGEQQGTWAEGTSPGGVTPEEIIESGEYLNQVLLDKGYAVRMEE